jgi:hypothetical protein
MQTKEGHCALALPSLSRHFPPAVAKGKVYIVTFRTHDDRRPSKFIVLADNMRAAITMAWEHAGADFQSRFDRCTPKKDLRVADVHQLEDC